jgi:ATP-grasp domain
VAGTLTHTATTAVPPRDGSGQPATVLFVDEHGWDCFFQLAVGLRRAGFRVVRATLAGPSRAASRFCFDRTVHLPGPAAIAGLGPELLGEDLVDVQVVDALAGATYGALAASHARGRATRWTGRAEAVDKLAVSRRLREQGLSVPTVVDSVGSDPDQLVELLGLPVVHKRRVGSGGGGVSIVESREALVELLDAGGSSGDAFFEQFVVGRHLQFGGVVSNGAVGCGVVFESLGRASEMGPASVVRPLEDEALVETGREVATALGIEGLLNVEVVRDPEGRDWIHDVNPRVWGSFAAFRAVGADVLGEYVTYLRDESGRAARVHGAADRAGTSGTPREIEVFPAAVDTADVPTGGLASGWHVLRAAAPYLRWIGARYVAYELVQQLRWKLPARRARRRAKRDGDRLTSN